MTARKTVIGVLLALSLSHLLNDTIQAILPAIYPLLKQSFGLSFAQVGLITLTYQLTASLLQPVVGGATDRRPLPFSLAAGMGVTLTGLLMLSRASSFGMILAAAALTGVGSSIFHPEASRIAHLAAGGRHGFAQSVFQVGGNLGTSLGPLLAALIIVPHGQSSIAWFSVFALLGIGVLLRVGSWYRASLRTTAFQRAEGRPANRGPVSPGLSRLRVRASLALLLVLVFSKYVYLVSLTNYYTFYLIHRFAFSIRDAQFRLFILLFAVALGTILGGPAGDRFGRRRVIWFSILGVAPFSIALPFAGPTGAAVLTVFIGLILASAFPAIVVYAQELIPGRVGLIAGLFFGAAFGVSGIASAGLGRLADRAGIDSVFRICGFLPLIGLAAALLPDLGGADRRR